jgi:predicted ribonuclease YlaK
MKRIRKSELKMYLIVDDCYDEEMIEQMKKIVTRTSDKTTLIFMGDVKDTK